jgi:hypothetical protein
MDFIKRYAKAFFSGISTASGYLAAVVPAEGGFSEVSLAQWLTGIPIVLGAFGIVAYVPNKEKPTHVTDQLPYS